MLRDEVDGIVRQVGWLSRQPRAFQDEILGVAELRHHPEGVNVYSLGDPPDYLWCLVDGELSVMIAPDSSPPDLVHVARPGWWVGEGALLTDTPRRAGLTARRDSWTLRVGRGAIDGLAARDPQVWRRIGQITVGHFDHALSIVSGLMLRDSHARVALTLKRLADLDNVNQAGRIILDFSQEELGAMTRLTRNVIAAILMDMETAGLIKRRYRGVEIADIAALDRYAKSRSNR